ncbi:flagella basal body P-ring formation protein FlgA [Gammaproteobacteria bacterium 42_54_T18]|nr:flagella basal body P-ring formation protein FlgA [Gammaproteobacteria bacterium 42_54_T18]
MNFLIRCHFFWGVLLLSVTAAIPASEMETSIEKEAITLQVYPKITWEKTTLPLSVLATIYAEKSSREYLEGVDVDISTLKKATETGKKINLRMISDVLTAKLSGLGYTANVVGPENIMLQKRLDPADSERIIDIAQKALFDVLNEQFDVVKLVPTLKSVNGYSVIPGDMLRVKQIDFVKNIAKLMVVWVDVIRAGDLINSIPVGFAVKAYKDVQLLARDLKKHQVIGFSDLTSVSVDVAGLKNNAVYNHQMLLGSITKRRLIKGRVLKLSDVLPAPDVVKGEVVNVVSKVGIISITGRALALSHGYRGQMIVVMNEQSGMTYNAFVSGKGLLRVGDKG